MIYRFLADLILVLHLAFVLFALFGGLLVLRHAHWMIWHMAALAWGVVVQWANWICPLTPLENQLRHLGGQAGYAGGFLERWISTVLYPDMLTLELRYLLGLILLLVNLAIYAAVVMKRKRCAHPEPASSGAHHAS
jgi:hypothetical protein